MVTNNERIQANNAELREAIELAEKLPDAGSGGTPTPTQEKTVNITENGTHTVTPDDGYALSKVTANVSVPIPDGYIIPSGTKEITENGTHSVTEFESVDVNVPIPDGYIQPSGSLEITENGEYDITDKASVIVDVEEGIVLPALANPASAEQIVVGYDAINDEGAVVVGTNPYEKSATDEEVNTQADLIEQLASILEGKAASSGGITISDINLHDISTDKADIYLSGDKELAYNGWDATDYIPVRADRSYLIYSTLEISGQYCNKYDASKTRIGGLPTPCNSTVKVAPFLYPGFDGYLRFSGTRQQIANLAVFEAEVNE